MPRLSTPPEMPREVLDIIDIIDVIGNHARTEILRLLSRGPSSALDLAETLNIHHTSVHRHLVQLERHGLVKPNPAVEPGRRQGQKHVTWSPVPERLRELAHRWLEYASGSDPETPADEPPDARGTEPS